MTKFKCPSTPTLPLEGEGEREGVSIEVN